MQQMDKTQINLPDWFNTFLYVMGFLHVLVLLYWAKSAIAASAEERRYFPRKRKQF